MTSSGRELLKWLAALLMTGDHAAKLLFGGYVPVLSELGRIAFPLFALVMAYNLAQPGADLAKSIKRLALWGIAVYPVYAWAFDLVLPANVLLSFALAAACCWSLQNRRWWLLLVFAGPLPLYVDYQWSGVALVVTGWLYFQRHGRASFLIGSGDFSRGRLYLVLPIWVWFAMALLCFYNGNAWALLALPLMALGQVDLRVPRTGWAFYVYYVAHIGFLALIS